jgi:hypothetical protein
MMHVKGQLELEFESIESVGTLDEAMELWESVRGRSYGNNAEPPEGWEYIDSGGTRMVFKSPTGVCYKVCHEYEGYDKSHNDVEHNNFRRIEREGKLPKNWRVPKSRVHVFSANMRRWDYHMKREIVRPGRVAVLACDFISGEALGWRSTDEDQAALQKAFSAVGLHDTGGYNAVRCEDGTHYIIDAAELMEN